MSLGKFPGFIDVHVHLREPGATQKEDFYTGSRAAIKGGFTYILDMPNNPIPTFSQEALQEKINLSQKAMCDVGFHYGTNGKNIASFPTISINSQVFGLKLYCNHTTGDYLIENPVLIDEVFKSWESNKPILVHAEGEKLALAIDMAKKYKRRLHVCHISLVEEVKMVRQAKNKKLTISAGVCPHHLFMTDKDRETKGSYALMKPPLGTIQDQEALWEGLLDGTIDLVETDHAPHTKEEKQGEKPMFGVPGLETALGLLFKAVHDRKISQEDVIKFLYENPKRIFGIPDQLDTYIEADSEEPYIVGEDGYESKCGWSSYDGWELFGKVQTVVFKGKKVLENGTVL